MQCARDYVHPAAIPYWETIEWYDGKRVGIVSLPADAPDKPYKAKRGASWITQIRVGTLTRDATNPEEMRLYQQSGHLQYDRGPVPDASLQDLDQRRLIHYLGTIYVPTPRPQAAIPCRIHFQVSQAQPTLPPPPAVAPSPDAMFLPNHLSRMFKAAFISAFFSTSHSPQW